MNWTGRLTGFYERLKLLVAEFGYKVTLRHVITRLIGTPRFMRPSSLMDFRHAPVKITADAQSFLEILLPTVSADQIRATLSEGESVLSKTSSSGSLAFPENWNSGRNLRLIVFSLTRILKPKNVVETGTANGASADAWATALRLNGKGLLTSFDIVTSPVQLVKPENLSFVSLVQTNGSIQQLLAKLKTTIKSDDESPSIFLHDSDHSYFGQYGEYKVASNLKFDILLSDDVDSSMAFLDFIVSGLHAVVMIDGHKMIGGIRLGAV